MNFARGVFPLAVVVTVGAIAFQAPSFAQQTTPQNTYQGTSPKNVDYGEQAVFYNTQTHKFRKPSCVWAKRCTKNCIPLGNCGSPMDFPEGEIGDEVPDRAS